jgi:outer membrane protein assembly factor BamB
MAEWMNRRRLFTATGAALVSGGAFAQAPRAPGRPPIEPNTVKRRGTGLRAYDPDRAYHGFTLFAPSNIANKTVYLVDMEGNVVHTWELPHPPGLYGYLTPAGTLFYNGKIPNSSHIGKSAFKGGAALEVDWKGKVLWEVRQDDHHHDGLRLRNGNVLFICGRPLPDGIAQHVRGGRPGTEYDNGTMNGDYLVEMTTDGKLVWEWRAWEHLDPVKDAITAPQDDRDEWTHANGVFEMPDGNLMLSFRNISTVIMINRATGEVYWKLGAPPLSGQHAPVLLANGNVLLFDNGPHRVDTSLPFSRVLEIDPKTKEIVWRYQEGIVTSFYSPRVSNAQRLPNGNTLIAEGVFGRLFEVTPEGSIVWEYVNPYFGPRVASQASKPELHVNQVFRAYRYSPAEIERARGT